MNIFKRKEAAQKRSRTAKGVPSAGEFAVETRSEAVGVVLKAPAVLTDRTGPLTQTDKDHIATAAETIMKQVEANRAFAEETGSTVNAFAASIVEGIPGRLRDAETVGEASEIISSASGDLARQELTRRPTGIPGASDLDLRVTLVEMGTLVGTTDERTGIMSAADQVDVELNKLRSYAEETGSTTHRATAGVAANLPKELQVAGSAEEACAAVDRVDQDLLDGGYGIAFLKEHSQLRSSLAGIREGIESAAGRSVPRLTREERAADDARRADFKALMARSERAHGRVGFDGNFAAR